jgi:hypothetical protein
MACICLWVLVTVQNIPVLGKPSFSLRAPSSFLGVLLVCSCGLSAAWSLFVFGDVVGRVCVGVRGWVGRWRVFVCGCW